MITEAQEPQRARHLALILRGIADLEREKAVYLTGWKDRIATLQDEAARLTNDILTGQMTLVSEPETAA